MKKVKEEPKEMPVVMTEHHYKSAMALGGCIFVGIILIIILLIG
jgi:hypothetical protein